MNRLLHSSFRTNRAPHSRSYRPFVEFLEDRLPPGDAFIGPAFSARWLESWLGSTDPRGLDLAAATGLTALEQDLELPVRLASITTDLEFLTLEDRSGAVATSPAAATPVVNTEVVAAAWNASPLEEIFSSGAARTVLPTRGSAEDAAPRGPFSTGDVAWAAAGASLLRADVAPAVQSGPDLMGREGSAELEGLVNAGGSTQGPTGPVIGFEAIATGLAFPVAITNAADGYGRLFITLQRGQVVIHDGTQVLKTPFLDITSRVWQGTGNDERGLLSVAFHPYYYKNGLFYVNYVNRSNNTVIERFSVSADDPNVADVNSGQIVMTITQPNFGNHKGGQLQFGWDGYLYIGTGDGGSAGDPNNRAQNLADPLGKMLRIDVDNPDPGRNYGIPPSNPYFGVPGVRQEIWASGLRNPWRFSFDRYYGDLYIADVGQSAWEEVDFQPWYSGGGENYGWRRMEGAHCYNPQTNCDDGTLTYPVLEYGRSLGISITGGYVYRGYVSEYLQGAYLYGDFGSGRIWAGSQDEKGNWYSVELVDTNFAISTFGEDEGGEHYVAHRSASGVIYRIVPTA